MALFLRAAAASLEIGVRPGNRTLVCRLTTDRSTTELGAP